MTEVEYQETWWGKNWGYSTEIKMNFYINVNIKGRLIPDGEIQTFNKFTAQLALAKTFDYARKLTYDEWVTGDIPYLNLMEKFLGNLNWTLQKGLFSWPAYAQPVKPGGWNGVPISLIRFNGLFIFW